MKKLYKGKLSPRVKLYYFLIRHDMEAGQAWDRAGEIMKNKNHKLRKYALSKQIIFS